MTAAISKIRDAAISKIRDASNAWRTPKAPTCIEIRNLQQVPDTGYRTDMALLVDRITPLFVLLNNQVPELLSGNGKSRNSGIFIFSSKNI